MIQRAVRIQTLGVHSGLRITQKSSLRRNDLAGSRKWGKHHSNLNLGRFQSHIVHSKDDSELEGSAFLKKSTEFVDGIIEKQKKTLKQHEETDEQLQLQIEALRAREAPKFAVDFLEWLIKLNISLRETEVKRLKDLEADRNKYVAEWTEFEKSTQNAEPEQVENLMMQVATGEDAAVQATSLVISAFVSASLLSWGSTFFGVNVATLLPDPSLPSLSNLSTWAAWTLPYIGATLAAGAILGPQFISNRGTFRFLAEDAFFSKLHPTAVLSVSSALAYSQAVTYQAVWLLLFLNLFRGDGTFSLDPAAADEAAVQQAMGSLVAGPKLLGLIAAPAAVVSTAAIEAGYFLLKETINSTVQEVFQGDAAGDTDESDTGFRVLSGSTSIEPSLISDDGLEEVTSMIIQIGRRPPKVPSSLKSLEMPAQEFWLTSGRVFLASLWMGAETLVTGNLWMAATTGAVGMAVAMAAKRATAKEAGVGDDS